jgi:hypothetical protein
MSDRLPSDVASYPKKFEPSAIPPQELQDSQSTLSSLDHPVCVWLCKSTCHMQSHNIIPATEGIIT